MRGVRPVFVLALLSSLLSACARPPAARQDPPAKPGSAPPFAVVELFTSEGCSSCPPADQHLADIEADARSRHKNVFALSFHVDYWNYLGWQDPFSDARYSERQKLYAEALSGGQLYTPQMVVNGREEFVGSARAKASDAIDRVLQQPSALSITVTPKLAARALEVGYRIQGNTHNAVLHLALTQPALGVTVSRGENAGRTLTHRGVVRALESGVLDGETTGSIRLEMPAGVEPEKAALVVFVADRQTQAMLGATSLPLARYGIPIFDPFSNARAL
jgi:hypothetical protein